MNPGDSDEHTSAMPAAAVAVRLVRSTLTVPESGLPDGADRNPHEVTHSLHTLPELARQLVNADYGAVTVTDGAGRVTEMLYAGMTPEQADKIGEPPRGTGLLGRLGESDSPLRLETMSGNPHSSGFPPDHPEMESLLGVRVTSGGDIHANLYVARRPGAGGFSADDEKRIVALASYAAIALDNAHLYQDEYNLRATAEAAEQRLAAVIRGSAAGVIVKDANNGEFLHISGEAHRITGIDFSAHTSEDENHPFERLYHHPDGARMESDQIPINVALRTGATDGPDEVLFIRADGSKLPVIVSAAPVFDSYGNLDSAVCVFVDVTRLKELERAKDDFLSMITHDLRTPLTTIKGMAAEALVAATNSDTESAVSFLEPIDDEVDYLTELVSNLLDMTRIEAGGDLFDFEVCHLTDIAQDSLARMNRTRDARGRDIHIDVPVDLPAIYADPGQIGRVLDNLVSNALKYSDKAIGITAKRLPGKEQVCVEVDDYGPGIPSGQKTAIFDRFARLKGSGRNGRQGSGLGLAICKSIITAHSGQIGVEPRNGGSERGANGSVFWFTLPTDKGDSGFRQRQTGD